MHLSAVQIPVKKYLPVFAILCISSKVASVYGRVPLSA